MAGPTAPFKMPFARLLEKFSFPFPLEILEATGVRTFLLLRLNDAGISGSPFLYLL